MNVRRDSAIARSPSGWSTSRQDLILSASASMGGSIYYVPGHPSGLGSAGITQINQDTPGVHGPVEHHSDGHHGRFGASLAADQVEER